MLFTLGALKNLSNFAGKIHVLESLFKKGPQPCKFIKKSLQHRYFPVKLARLSRALFYRTSPVAGFKISNSNILFKDTSGIPLTYN